MKSRLNNMWKTIAVAIFVTAMFFIPGCTELERQGYSPIPQNSPGGWEMDPYR